MLLPMYYILLYTSKDTNSRWLYALRAAATQSPTDMCRGVAKSCHGIILLLSCDILLQRSEDTDYQLATTTLEATWSGFEDGSQAVSYRVGLGSTEGSDDVSAFVAVASSSEHKFTDLSLQVDSVSRNIQFWSKID